MHAVSQCQANQMCRKSKLVLLVCQPWHLLRMVLQSSKPFSLKWWHSLLYFSEVVLLWKWSRQCSWAKSLILGKHSDRILDFQEGINPMCGFCLLSAWANSCHNLKMSEYVLHCCLYFFWSQSGEHRGGQGCCWGTSLPLAPPAPTRADAYLEAVLTNKEEPVGDVLNNGILGCIDHEIVE